MLQMTNLGMGNVFLLQMNSNHYSCKYLINSVFLRGEIRISNRPKINAKINRA